VRAIVITHGDADHFAGLHFIRDSESFPDQDRHQRLLIRPELRRLAKLTHAENTIWNRIWNLI
jgi:glyoxylase-like metal-dependent hydrolase (beta-lactamase superfamily II)